MNVIDLPPRQAQALSFIRKFIVSNGYSPSSRELAAHLEVTQTAAVQKIRALERAGLITTVKGIPRSIALV